MSDSSSPQFPAYPPGEFPAHNTATETMRATYVDLQMALQRSAQGVGVRIHQLDNTVTFVLDNQQEVVLRVRKIDIEHKAGQVLNLQVHCRTDFENVLILAKKLNMRIGAFSQHFTVILAAEPAFIDTWNAEILQMEHPSQFFETLDEIKRPIFLNLNHYIIARISD